MGGFVYYSLGKILKLSNKSKDKKLRTAAIDVQKQIFTAFQQNREAAKADRDADKYLLPFKLACDYVRPNLKMLHTSLDAIQRMIAYGYLTGDSYVDPQTYPPVELDNQNKNKESKRRRRKLIDVLVETIYMCSTTIDDDQVQIQVIKTLITAVQSKSCNVHDHSILLAIRSCYHIYLTARNTSNQTTARAILTQMLNVVFRRMESYAEQLKGAKREATKHAPRSPEPLHPRPPTTDTKADDQAILGGKEGKADNEIDTKADVAAEIVHRIVDKVVEAEETEAKNKDVESQEQRKRQPKQPKGQPNGVKSPPSPAIPELTESQALQKRLALRLNVMQNDAYLLFRALTQLSMKKIPESIDPVAIKSKALALELLLSVLQNSGPTLRTHPKFVGFIKDKLVRSLLQNCVSSIPRIYKMAAPMFLALVSQLKPQMKYEIGVILNNIFLNMLASPMSSYMQKSMAVVILLKLCKDPQTIVELFLNFDCDITSEDKIFEAIIIQLEKVAQGRFMSEALMSPQNESSLRLNALEAMGHVMHSLIRWCAVLKEEERLLALKERKDLDRKESKELDDDESDAPSRGGDPSSDPGSVAGGLMSGRASIAKPAFSAQFNMQRERRNLIERGILLFNRKPKRGIKFLVDSKLLDNDPNAIAVFLKSHKKLDKTQIGEYMGEDKDFNKQVLYSYIEDFDFVGMQFDEALRYFLKGFRLPGEGQKIDRMVVKFADQYTTNNPHEKGGKFRTADGAYILAYSTIMLHTDLHNPGVKNKMSKEQFINMNRGIDDGQDIDPSFMSYLYDKIQQEEIHMTDNAPSEWQNAANLNPRKRQTMFQKQTESLIKKTESLIRKKPTKSKRRISRKHLVERKQAGGRKNNDDTMTSPGGSTGVSTQAATSMTVANGEKQETGDGNTDPSSVQATSQAKTQPTAQPTTQTITQSAIQRTTQAISEDIPDEEDDVDQEWYDAKHADLDSLQPMFDLLWCPAFATFSLVLKENDDPHVARLCLDNYRAAVHLSSLFGMDTPRDAFVKSLQHFSLLGTTNPLTYKNVEAIKMLLQIAYTEGDYLQDSWSVVLQCISEYDKLMRRSPASQTPVDVFDNGMPHRTDRETKKSKRQITKTQQIQQQNAEILRSQLDPALIDRVFTHSAHLNSDAIVDFVKSLTQVSQTEVYTMNETPRVFSLQKIVEITYYNMNRIRLVWTRIWNILSAYFAKAGCHPNLQVSLYSIDSLRQLAMKFLEKDELAHYHFQKQFLKPFEIIMENTNAQESKALIIQCISRMVLGRVSNVRSGWKSVFVVLRIAASDADKSLVVAAFALMERIMLNYFALISNTLGECVVTLGSFSQNSLTQYSLKALDYLAKVATYLAHPVAKGGASLADEKDAKDGNVSTRELNPLDEKGAGTTRGTTRNTASGSGGASRSGMEGAVDKSHFQTWMLLLTCLSRLVTDNRIPLQTRALNLLFDTLSKHGNLFSLENWEAIFIRILFPVFDGVGVTNAPPPPSEPAPKRQPRRPPMPRKGVSPEWLKTTCLKAMTKVVRLFAQYQDKIQKLLPDVLALTNSCISQGNIHLAKIGIECWKLLMSLSGSKFDDENWGLVLESLHSLFEQTLPHELQAPRLRKSLGLPAKSPRGSPELDGGRVKSTPLTEPPTSTTLTNTNSSTNGAAPPPEKKRATEKQLIQTDLLISSRVFIKCEIHREMFKASLSIIDAYYPKLKQDHVESLLHSFRSSIDFLSTFNSDRDLRNKLYSAGFRGPNGEVFNMVDQEVEAYGLYLKILQKMYQGGNPNFDDSKSADLKLREMGLKIFNRYIAGVKSLEGKSSSELKTLGITVCSLIEGFTEYTEEQLKANLRTFLPRMFDLMEYGSVDVRRAVANFMRKRTMHKVLEWAD
ncbi:hypothetical protein AAMO2058_000133400 [Amorphochlora amoebiformis]